MKKINKSIIKNLSKPKKKSHKGDNGVLLVIGGSDKYHGAPWYSIEIASKIVDLVYFHSDKMTMRLLNEIKKKSPSFITIEKKELDGVIKKSDSILIGPGWGESTKNKKLLNNLLKKHKNMKFILDADALKMVDKKLLNENCIITPHAREFNILFNKKASLENAKAVSKSYKVIIVLKGTKDIVCSPDKCYFNTSGNQGMTKGGTGDVLAGLIAALACKNNLFLAAQVSVLINGLAGENLYKKVGVYYNAQDLILEIPKIIKKYL